MIRYKGLGAGVLMAVLLPSIAFAKNDEYKRNGNNRGVEHRHYTYNSNNRYVPDRQRQVQGWWYRPYPPVHVNATRYPQQNYYNSNRYHTDRDCYRNSRRVTSHLLDDKRYWFFDRVIRGR